MRKALDAYDWPGNVRELRNLIESMVVLDSDGVLDLDDLPDGDIAAARARRRTAGERARRPGRPAADRGRALLHASRRWS